MRGRSGLHGFHCKMDTGQEKVDEAAEVDIDRGGQGECIMRDKTGQRRKIMARVMEAKKRKTEEERKTIWMRKKRNVNKNNRGRDG